MASSVSVLAPNGRRQTVKCTPNTTILQIIEEVCRKQGFQPENYDIKHHNKVLDTTISFRFSGLPNNAQLELASATKARIDSEITLAVSLEDGSRLIGNFLPDETLWNVLLKLCPSEVNEKQNPVVIYMRNEVYGDKLLATSLRSLGLRGGRAMMRVIHKRPEDLNIQAGVSAPLPHKIVEQKPKIETDKNSAVPIQKKEDLDFAQLLAREREKRKLEDPAKVVEPEAQSPRTKPKFEITNEIMEVNVELPNNDTPASSKKRVESPKASEVYEQEANFVFLGDRQAMLFSLESAQSVPTEDLPDDFFELTIDDAKKILQDIRRKRHEMENANLMTSAMRNIEESKKQLRQLHKYKQAVIRVQFPDRTILQGSFKPRETIQDVKDFVKNYLHEEKLDFYLYTTPPKSILNEKERLLDIGCVPGALVHLGSNVERSVSLKSDLKDKFTTNSVASLAALKLRKETTRMEERTEGDEDDSMETSTDDVDVAGPSSQPTNYERKVIKSTEKVPKWFRPSK